MQQDSRLPPEALLGGAGSAGEAMNKLAHRSEDSADADFFRCVLTFKHVDESMMFGHEEPCMHVNIHFGGAPEKY